MSKHLTNSSKNPGTAAVLSFVIPGLGQIYNGQFLWAVLWLLFTPGFWLGTGGTLGWIAHILSAWFAYRAANEISSNQLASGGARSIPSAL